MTFQKAAILSSRTLYWFSTLFFLIALGAVRAVGQTPDLGPGASLHGKPVFPANNPWNQDVSALPVDPNSATLLATIGLTTRLHPDFVSGKNWTGVPFGIPYVVVAGTQPSVPVRFDYSDESDPGPYPIPPDAPIEGGADADGDRHVLVIDRDHWTLYEMYYAFPQADGSWTGGSGAAFNLASNALRPIGWTSADAAGLPIFPGLARYDEVVGQGVIRHALRFTVARSRRAFVSPARHLASAITDPKYPPMGMRVRLKASYNIAAFPAQARVILTAMKKYGMIVADNGSNWYFSGAPDARWDDDQLDTLKTVPGSAFEVVKMGDVITDTVAAPRGLRATAGAGRVALTWTASAGATGGYRVKRATVHGGPYTAVGSVTGGAAAYTNTGLTGGTKYYYVVTAVNATGQSYDSNEASATPTNSAAVPPAPTNLVARAVSPNQIDLTWTNTATNATSVHIERSLDGVSFLLVATPGGTTKAWSAFNLKPGTTYYYHVRTANLAGTSAWTNVVSAKTPAL